MNVSVSKRFLICSIFSLALATGSSFSQNIPVALGNFGAALDKLELANYNGEKHSLATYKNRELTIFIVLSHDCPICQQYGATLRQLSEKYADIQLQVIGIAPADGATAENIQSFATTYRLGFPILLDQHKIFARLFDARVTPEVFLVDSTGELLYRGQINNWFFELGRYRNVITAEYLDDAIRAFKAGEVIDPNRTEPIGCLLNMSAHH